jgi:hypothetical protein
MKYYVRVLQCYTSFFQVGLNLYLRVRQVDLGSNLGYSTYIRTRA